MKDLYLIVKVSVKENGAADGPDVVDILQQIITVGYEGELEGPIGEIGEIKVLQGYCED